MSLVARRLSIGKQALSSKPYSLKYTNFISATELSVKLPTYTIHPYRDSSLDRFPKYPTGVVESGINKLPSKFQVNIRPGEEDTAGAVRVVLQAQFSLPTKES